MKVCDYVWRTKKAPTAIVLRCVVAYVFRLSFVEFAIIKGLYDAPEGAFCIL